MSPRTRTVVPRDPDEHRRQASIIGGRIRELRLSRGMTQSQVAGTRFSKAYISALETGIAFPSMTSLQFLAGQLHVSPDWFLTEQPMGEAVAMPATISRVWFAEGRVFAELHDGRALGMPLARSRKLMAARMDQLDAWEITDFGRVITWPAVGEEIGLEDFLGMRMLAPSEVHSSVSMHDAASSVSSAHSSRSAGGGRRPRRKRSSGRPGRYAALTEWLSSSPEQEIRTSFADIELRLGRSLPPSARRYAAPWSSAGNPLAKAIRLAGWRASANLASERVTLRRR